MLTPEKRWEIYPRASEEHFAQFPDIQPLITQILYNRGISQGPDVYQFLSDTPITHNPYDMKGVTQAVAVILQAIQQNEPIVVYGDYDADGVTSTALLVQALKTLSANVQPYIPDRFEEGYGLNRDAIAQLAQAGNALIITVDCGIRSVEEVAYGNSLGLKFIITDHHQVPQDENGADIVPPALAVINPHQTDCTYPFKDLAGVGVTYKLIQALKEAIPAKAELPGLRQQDLLDLVAIGAVADMVPLIDENRSFVKQGLVFINHPQRAGLKALIEQSQLKMGKINAGTIGFTIGPRLNAAGRLQHALAAYELLTTQDSAIAHKLALELHQVNVERQNLTETYVDRAKEQILQDRVLAPLYLIEDDDFNEGVVGLVASRLTDQFYRPVLVAHRGGEFSKGSGRSIPEFDITRALDQCADMLVKYGGHAAAAGFTIETARLNQFRKQLTQIAQQQFEDKNLRKTLFVDAELNLRGVSHQLVEDIQALQPFGYSNPTPKFVSRNLIVRSHSRVGRDQAHLKLKLFDGKNVWDAIGFRMGHAWPVIERQTPVDALYTLEFNTWNGHTRLQLNLKDLKLSSR